MLCRPTYQTLAIENLLVSNLLIPRCVNAHFVTHIEDESVRSGTDHRCQHGQRNIQFTSETLFTAPLHGDGRNGVMDTPFPLW